MQQNVLKELGDILMVGAPDNCVAVNVTFTYQGAQVEYTIKEPQCLKDDGISMRDIGGHWIK